MDTTDSKISFDANGVCDHCHDFHKNVLPNWHTDERGWKDLQKYTQRILAEGKGKSFDCIIGLSGGLDSSYMTHVAVRKLGLRPLVFHVDCGWDSQEGVHNIEVIVDKLGLDLYTEVIDWEEMKDFQLSFFKAGVSNIDIPQDHAIVATMYHFAYKHKIKYILNGGNYSTECVRNPLEWIYHGTDTAQIKDIHRQFGINPLVKYPLSNILWHKIYLRYIKRIEVLKPLNYVPYIKKEAIQLLVSEYGWQSYPQKHFESRFTKFYEGYWLPKKFGFDTRKVQYSSLILTNQMSRSEALEKLSKPAYDENTIEHDFDYIATKLGISAGELRGYLNAPNKSYKDYKSQANLFAVGAKVMKVLGLERAVKR
jgi:N-acetyl sugar amidotransferase